MIASLLQRALGIGYTRASRLIDMMCDNGVVGPHVGSKARECLLTLEEWEANVAAEQAAGNHQARWDGLDHAGRSLPSGVYLAVLETGGARATTKLVLAR